MAGHLCRWAWRWPSLACAGGGVFRRWPWTPSSATWPTSCAGCGPRPRNLRSYLIVWLIAIGCTFVGFWLVLDSLIFAVLISAFLAAGPWYLLRRMAERRRQKIEDQLADAMVMLANAVRAGLSLAQSMEILAAQCPKPINAEFHQIVAEYNMGKPLERTLTEAKERLRSENFALFAAALLASHESGGRLERDRRADRPVGAGIAAAGAEGHVGNGPGPQVGRLHGHGPGVDPGGLLLRRSGEHDAAVHADRWGKCCWPLAVVLNVVAYLWARVILNPDI